MKVDDIIRLFVLNFDSYGVQTIQKETNNVVYYKQNQRLTHEILKKHLDGTASISTFPVHNGKTKWFCIDVDLLSKIYKDPGFTFDEFKEKYADEIRSIALLFKARLETIGITSYTEHTGGKGMHVWAFFNPPVAVSEITETLLPQLKDVAYDKELFNVEFFPVSENSLSVKIPGGKSIKWKGEAGEDAWSIMETPLESIVTNSPEALFHLSNPMLSIFTKCQAFRTLKEKADTERHLSHFERLAIASMVYKRSQREIDFVENYYFTGLNNYSAKETRSRLDAASNELRPQRCAHLQEKGICQAQCKEIGNFTSPVSFGVDAKDKTRKLSIETAAIIEPSQNIVIRDNSVLEMTRNGELIRISDFIIKFDTLEELEEGDVDIRVTKQVYSGNIIKQNGEEYPISISREKFLKDEGLLNEIYSVLRIGGLTLDSKKLYKLRMAIDKYSDPDIIKKTRNFGFNKEHTAYYSPSVKVDANGVYENKELVVEISDSQEGGIEKFLDLRLNTDPDIEYRWKEFFKNTFLKLYVNKYAPIAVFGFITDIFIKHKFLNTSDAKTYALWVVGETGSGKSSLVMFAQRMFGEFSSLNSCSSTANMLEKTGYNYKDCLFAIDDFKRTAAQGTNLPRLITMIQNAADKTGKGRLGKDLNVRTTYHIRGNMLINGEDVLIEESSAIARVLVLHLRNSDIKVDHDIYREISERSLRFNEWTPHFIKWCMNIPDEEAKQVYDDMLNLYRKTLGEGGDNVARVSINVSKLSTTTYFFCKYVWGDNDAEFKAIWKEMLVFFKSLALRTLSAVKEESYAFRFWETLQDLLATNQVRILATSQSDDDNRVPIIGFIKDAKVYILHNQAVTAINKHMRAGDGAGLKVSSNILAENLATAGFYEKSVAERKFLNNKQVRVHTLATDKIKELLDV